MWGGSAPVWAGHRQGPPDGLFRSYFDLMWPWRACACRAYFGLDWSCTKFHLCFALRSQELNVQLQTALMQVSELTSKLGYSSSHEQSITQASQQLAADVRRLQLELDQQKEATVAATRKAAEASAIEMDQLVLDLKSQIESLKAEAEKAKQEAATKVWDVEPSPVSFWPFLTHLALHHGCAHVHSHFS